MNEFDGAAFVRFLGTFADRIHERRDELTRLDSAIGDADHGINMDRGFTAVRAKLAELDGSDLGATAKAVGMTLISTVGGASGPLYGTFFLRLATAFGDAHGSSTRPSSGRRCEPAWRGSSSAARPRSTTRRWSTPWPGRRRLRRRGRRRRLRRPRSRRLGGGRGARPDHAARRSQGHGRATSASDRRTTRTPARPRPPSCSNPSATRSRRS